MMTLVVDGMLPFIIISILNTLIIRAIRQRHRELETFNEENMPGSLSSTETGNLSFCTRRNLSLAESNDFSL